MKEYVFQPLLHLETAQLASIVDLDASLHTLTVPSSLTNLPAIYCPIEINKQATSWGSTDHMQWQHHIITIGHGKHKQQLIGKTNWQWRNKKDIGQAGLSGTIQRISAHKYVKELLARFLTYLESTVVNTTNITLKILLDEVSTMRVSLPCHFIFILLF